MAPGGESGNVARVDSLGLSAHAASAVRAARMAAATDLTGVTVAVVGERWLGEQAGPVREVALVALCLLAGGAEPGA